MNNNSELNRFNYKIAPLLLVVLILVLPFQLLLYVPCYYHILFSITGTYDRVETDVNKQTIEIIAFFSYRSHNISFLQEDEMNHMIDVRRLFLILHIITLCMVFFLIMKRKIIKIKQKKLKCILRWFLLGMLAVGVVSYFLFDNLFDIFHIMLFPQGNWIFPLDSPLIQLFSEKFFKLFFMHSLGISFIILMILYVYIWQGERSQKAKQ